MILYQIVVICAILICVRSDYDYYFHEKRDISDEYKFIIGIVAQENRHKNYYMWGPYFSYEPQKFCVGSVIKPDIILTSAWCTDYISEFDDNNVQRENRANLYAVHFDAYYRSDPSQSIHYLVRNQYIKKLNDSERYMFNVLQIERDLDTSFEFGTIDPILGQWGALVEDGTITCKIFGFGQIREHTSHSNFLGRWDLVEHEKYLMYVEVKPMEMCDPFNSDDEKYGAGDYSSKEVCVQSIEKDNKREGMTHFVCDTHWGGPLVCNNKVLGVYASMFWPFPTCSIRKSIRITLLDSTTPIIGRGIGKDDPDFIGKKGVNGVPNGNPGRLTPWKDPLKNNQNRPINPDDKGKPKEIFHEEGGFQDEYEAELIPADDGIDHSNILNASIMLHVISFVVLIN